jgi:sugar phosphate isomerase/epimerase
MTKHRWFSQSSCSIPLALLVGGSVLLAACSSDDSDAAPPSMGPEALEPGGSPEPVAGERHLNSIGVQLYTVRAAMEQDFEGTLRSIAAMGYQEVEFAGLFGQDPVQVRQLLAELNLTAVGSHIDWTRFRDDPNGAIEETLALGAKYMVFPWTPDTERQTLAQWHDRAALLNQVGQASREQGLELAYHNHDFEFMPVEGVRPYDLLLDEIDRNVVKFELDLYWLAKGAGGEPSELFERYPGGFPLGHVKDMRSSDQAIVDVGQGDLDFAAVFAQAEQSGMQHFIVEHDTPTDPMQTAENSITYLKQLTF